MICICIDVCVCVDGCYNSLLGGSVGVKCDSDILSDKSTLFVDATVDPM